jgi:fermentation-respiration switch protein FrsA (DUF1100 family)
VLVGIVAAAALLTGGLWLLQRRLIYLPGGGVPSITAILPGWEDVGLATTDGIVLGGWYHPPLSDAPVVVVFNGNAGNRSGRAPLGRRLAAAGYGVLLFDYRGYGDNPGSPSEAGLAADARAAARFVAGAAPGHAVFYFGESVGAAVAIELAAEAPPAGLIARSPFTSLADVAGVHYPYLPAAALLRDEYPSLDRIGSIEAPLLVIAGSADTIVPPEQSRRLFEAAVEPKRLLIVADADHNDAALLAGDELIDAVTAFMDEQRLP